MPSAKEKATAVVANAPPTASSQPVFGVAAAQARRHEQPEPGDDGGAEQPARLPAEGGVEQAQRPCVAAEDAARAAARPSRVLRPAGLAGQAPEVVVSRG